MLPALRLCASAPLRETSRIFGTGHLARAIAWATIVGIALVFLVELRHGAVTRGFAGRSVIVDSS